MFTKAHMTRVARQGAVTRWRPCRSTALHRRQQIFDLGGIPNVVAAMTKFRRDADVQVAGAMVSLGDQKTTTVDWIAEPCL